MKARKEVEGSRTPVQTSTKSRTPAPEPAVTQESSPNQTLQPSVGVSARRSRRPAFSRMVLRIISTTKRGIGRQTIINKIAHEHGISKPKCSKVVGRMLKRLGQTGRITAVTRGRYLLSSRVPKKKRRAAGGVRRRRGGKKTKRAGGARKRRGATKGRGRGRPAKKSPRRRRPKY